MSKKWTVHILNAGQLYGQQMIRLNPATVKALKLPDTLSLHFGSQKHTVQIHSTPKQTGIGIPASLASQLGLKQGMTVCGKYKARTNSLHIGPLIAVMMSRTYAAEGQPFASNTAFCEELSEAIRMRGGVVYFITPSNIEKRSHSIQAKFYQNGWKSGTFPLPDAVYNRLTSRRYEGMRAVKQFIHETKQRGFHVFNEKYLDKTEVFSTLYKDALVHKYMPESHLFKNFTMLKHMLSRHRTVYLKPISGSLGKGIIRITKASANKYVCHTSSVNRASRTEYVRLTKCFAAIAGKLKSRKYQIQQGISLITVGGRPVDFRALVQKNNTGKWRVISIVARIAGSDHVVSNLARGGTLSKVTYALSHSNLPSSLIARVSSGLKQAAVDISASLEKHLEEHFAEFGVDLGVDTSGKVWLIEVNSKPSKNEGTQLSENRIRPSVRKMVQYIHFISGY
ncbi:YheC/YheD family protein [Marinicrinis lubricantis]|uniref:YheC/YheD family protein n=1 Tax=Marinicrinis lubricantis TaxID=2086470 RepID=A0ABW1IGZ6_9BACL